MGVQREVEYCGFERGGRARKITERVNEGGDREQRGEEHKKGAEVRARGQRGPKYLRERRRCDELGKRGNEGRRQAINRAYAIHQ